ncbi:MAG: dienelactone hydrolase family protein [Cyanobacteria bacterium P01_G01_bin.54]
MRKLLTLAIAACLGLVFWACSQTPNTASQGEKLFAAHEGDRPVATEITAFAPSQPVLAGTVTYGTTAAGEPMQGYLARPAEDFEPHPAIIVIHEWWGLNDNVATMTRRLAGEGYTALAVDMYGGQVAETREQALELVGTVRNDQGGSERAQENLRQAYAYLETTQNAPAIASLGWCFGGTWSLNTALLFPTELDAAVIYYGGGITTDPEQLKTLEMPIIGFFGEEDSNPDPATVAEFERVLQELDKSVEVHLYEGAGHAFANPSGTRYVAAAAMDAWEKTIAFLAEHL